MSLNRRTKLNYGFINYTACVAVCKIYKMSSGIIRTKVHGKYREVWVSDTSNCKNYKCFNPHDCPVQGAGGVRSSKERYMCLTNVYSGCPYEPEKKGKL